jgi:hypothetical protein
VSVSNPHKRKTPPPINCASRTAHNDGEKIAAAVRAQQRAELLAHRARQRTEAEWQAEYDAAMAETRAARER